MNGTPIAFASALVENTRTEESCEGAVRVADGELTVYDVDGNVLLSVYGIEGVWHEGGSKWYAQNAADMWLILREGGCCGSGRR